MVYMAYLFVHEKVSDYSNWRGVYDSLESAKAARGFQQTSVFQNASDPNEVVILESWDSIDHARGWGQSQELRDAMKNAGVIPQPTILFLEGT